MPEPKLMVALHGIYFNYALVLLSSTGILQVLFVCLVGGVGGGGISSERLAVNEQSIKEVTINQGLTIFFLLRATKTKSLWSNERIN